MPRDDPKPPLPGTPLDGKWLVTLRRRTPLQRRAPLVNRTSMRRTSLTRRAPLERGTELAASVVPLKRSPMKRSRVEAKLTKEQSSALAERSGGQCEIQTLDCRWEATDPCHRIGEGSGGRHGEAAEINDRLSNLLHGCRECHDWCHRNPAAARAEGWMLHNGDNPLTLPVHYRRLSWRLLDDVGGLEQCPAPADEVA